MLTVLGRLLRRLAHRRSTRVLRQVRQRPLRIRFIRDLVGIDDLLGTPVFMGVDDREAPAGVINRSSMISLALKFAHSNRIVGDYLEFGCHSGRTFRVAHLFSRYAYSVVPFHAPVHLWAFDSFEGLPASRDIDRFDQWPEGAFRTSEDEFHTILREAGVRREEYTVVKGFYERSLTAELQQAMAGVKAAVVYVDCDLYRIGAPSAQFHSAIPAAGYGNLL